MPTKAELLEERLEKFLDHGEGEIKRLAAEIVKLSQKNELLEQKVKIYDDFDVKGLVKAMEQMKAKQEGFVSMVKSSRRGLYISGIEDEKFNLPLALFAFRMGGTKEDFEKAGAGKEYELLKQVEEKHGDMYRASFGTSKSSHAAGDDKLGLYLVPDQTIADIIGPIYTKSVFINLTGEDGDATRVTVMDGLIGANVKIPQFEGGLIAYWLDEDDDYVESRMKTGDVEMQMKKLGVLARFTKDLQFLQSGAFDGMFKRDLRRAAAKKLDYTIAFGQGGKTPLGICAQKGIKIYSAESGKWGVQGTDALGGAKFQADWQGKELNFDGLEEMNLILEEDDIEVDDNMPTISSRRFFTNLRRMKVQNFDTQTANMPYLAGGAMLTKEKLKAQIGEYAYSNQFSTMAKPGASVNAPSATGAAKCSTVIKGQLSEYVLGRWVGVEIEDDAGKGKGFIKDQMYVKLSLRMGSCMRQSRAVIICPDAKVLP